MVFPTMTVRPDGPVRTDSPYPAAIVLASFSVISIVLSFPALLQHYHNRNVGATVLVASTICANLMVTTNAIIWSNDDIPNWYNGIGLCDIQVKLVPALTMVFPTSVFCILRALANAMDTNNVSWMKTTAQRRRGYIVDLICCVGIPLLWVPISYINQPVRYTIMGIGGCQLEQDGSWLGLVLIILPPIFPLIVCVYYSILIITRLLRYRRNFHAILANSDTTKSRFARLYGVCCLIVLALFPLNVYLVYQNVGSGVLPFSWNETHNPPEFLWNSAIMIPSYGTVFWDRIIWVLGSYLVFFFFGFGKDAVKVYQSLLLAIGLGRILPMLRPDYQGTSSITDTFSSFGSKARALLKRKGSNSTLVYSTTSTATVASTPSPKKITFLNSIQESRDENQQLPIHASPAKQQQQRSKLFSGFKSMFRKT